MELMYSCAPGLVKIDLVAVAKSVTYRERLRYDVLSMILRTENRQDFEE